MRWTRWTLSLVCAFSLAFLSRGEPALAALPASVTAGPSVEGISEYRLANGLRVLLVPDPSLDTITTNVTYLVGSRHEGYGEAGMAHLLEHLMFKGTPSHSNIKNEFLTRGVRYNGTTSYDRTNYFETFPASDDNLAWAISLEADRMVNSHISRQDLDSEMTVVRNEFESGENSPIRVLNERMNATAYLWHNYGRAVIGARSDIENVPIERLQAFYRHFYQPDNAVLTIAGKFEIERALELVAAQFGQIAKPSRTLRGTYTIEPTQDGEREVVLRRVGNVQVVAAVYHMPPGTHPDYAAVDMLTAILTHVPAGRLHKALIETGRAAAVFGSERQQREPGSAYFGASVRQDASLQAARDTLLSVVEGFAQKPVTGDEVARARTEILNGIEKLLTDTRALGITLSEFIALGDWRALFWYRDQVAKMTPADVQRVALAYLKPQNRTIGVFMPTDKPDRAEIPNAPDLGTLLADYQGRSQQVAGEVFDPSIENIEARTIRRTLRGGLKLALLPKKTRGETVVAQLVLHWGDEASTFDRQPACGVAGAMLSRGTTKRSREQLRDALDALRAHVNVSESGAGIDTIKKSLPEVLRITAEMLRSPSFPELEFEQMKRASLASLDNQKTDPGALAGLQIARHLNPYPVGHLYYIPTLNEREQHLKSLTLEEVRRCYNDFFGASNAELAVVGDFDPDEISRIVEELFGDWKSPHQFTRIPVRFFATDALNRIIETPDKANAVYRAAVSLQLRDDSPDYPALILGNYIFGGSSDARLTRRIREKEGLSYSVGSFLSAGSIDAVGEFGVSAIYAPQNRARVEAAVREEIERVLREGFTPEEVEAAKRGLLQARRVARSQDAPLAGRLVSYLYLGRTFKWDADFDAKVAALTSEQITGALRRNLPIERLSVVRAGDFDKAAAAVKPINAGNAANPVNTNTTN